MPNTAPATRKQLIVVEGPIGVGKTTLARQLAATFGASLILEQAEDNPFLERFYRLPGRYALPAQLSFLFQRLELFDGLRQKSLLASTQISDFMLAKDMLFAQLTLREEELVLYRRVYQALVDGGPQPDLLIYLQADAPTLLRRVQQRGRLYERQVDQAYLEALANAYQHYFLSYRDAPLLVVNAAQSDFQNQPRHYELLLEQIEQTSGGRRYFNPAL